MELERYAIEVGQLLVQRKLSLVTAESCTGGWVAQVITTVPGVSSCFERGFVVYSNLSKKELLGVREETLSRFGAVSEPTVREMAEGALARSNAQVALAVTGIAGPDGGGEDKPVGTVWLAWAGTRRETVTAYHLFQGNRQQVRQQSVEKVLVGLMNFICS